MSDSWATREFAQAPLWDERCRTTLTLACQTLAKQSELSFSRALGSRRKAMSHLFHHPKVTPDNLLQGHIQATRERGRNYPRLLIASDTTSCNFTTHPALEGLGPLNDKGAHCGFFVHSALAMNEAGVPLGILYQHTWTRDTQNRNQAKDARKRPFHEKESHKWLDALRGVEAALPQGQKALLIQDQEADVFAFFTAPRREGIDLLIRATHPRRLEVDAAESPRTLMAAMAVAPIVGQKTLLLPRQAGQNPQEISLTVRLQQVWIREPLNTTGKNAPKVRVPVTQVWVIRACEETPPPKEERPAICWTLLTTLPEVARERALELVAEYALRWRIERFHYVLKSGCGYEKLQISTLSALQKALSVYSIVAWRLLWLNYAIREDPEMPVSSLFSPEETEVLESFAKKPLTSVSEAVVVLARLAGFVPLPSSPVPGVKSLWLGLRKLEDVMQGYRLAKRLFSP